MESMMTSTTIYADWGMDKTKFSASRCLTDNFVFFKMDDGDSHNVITFSKKHIPIIEELLTKLRELPE